MVHQEINIGDRARVTLSRTSVSWVPIK